MNQRRIDLPYDKFVHTFAHELKKDVKQSLQVWETLKPEQAMGRQAAYAHIVWLLKHTADTHGIPLADIGLVDYEVPKLRDLR